MTQRFSFWEDLSIRENLEFVARIYAMPDRRQGVDATLERLGLHGRARISSPANLSGGWKQRLALAACMLHRAASCCCSTSRPPASIRKARREFWEEIHASPSRASPCWSARITWTRPSAATASSISLRAHHRARHGREVIKQSGLITFVIEGRDVRRLLPQLEGKPGVEHVAFFGAALHVSGHDRGASRTDDRALARPARHSTSARKRPVWKTSSSICKAPVQANDYAPDAGERAGGNPMPSSPSCASTPSW